MCVYTQASIHTYIYLLCQLRGLRRSDTPLARSTPSTQTLVSNTILKSKRLGLLGKMVD